MNVVVRPIAITVSAAIPNMDVTSGTPVVTEYVSGTTTFTDTGNGNIVITSTTLTAHDNGGNITIEG